MGVIDAVLQERRVKAGMKLRRDQMRIGGYGGGGSSSSLGVPGLGATARAEVQLRDNFTRW